MSEWGDIRISRHDKQRSALIEADDLELSMQVFVLSETPPPRWASYINRELTV